MKLILRVRFFLGLGLLSLSLISRFSWAEDWRPKSEQFQSRENREECSVYRSVFTSTQESLARKMSDLKELTDSTKKSFHALKECKKKNGLDSPDISDLEAKTAEMCGEAFDSWLMEGTHLMTVEEEIEKLRDEVSTLQGAVSRRCLPIVIAELK